jgi:tetratricopeptide (TPR) repeat protein
MPLRLSTLLLALVALIALTTETAAQRRGQEPKRPRAAAIVDTNDAQGYFDHGVDVFDRDPARAADAFYWASRINPAMADAFYARRAALLLRDDDLMRTYMQGGKRAAESKQLRQIDSLQLRALTLNPFLYRRLDRRMLVAYIRASTQRNLRQYGEEVNPGELDFAIEGWLRSAGVGMRAWLAYGDGDFATALDLYASAIRSTKEKAGYRMDRARIFAMRGAADSAIAEFREALAEMRKRDARELVVLYDSKAVAEHSIAVLLEQMDDVNGAREAYGRALQEDLSYHPAHMRLGLLAIAAGDTANAISELELAVQIAPDDPYTRYVNGFTLVQFGKLTEAVEQLKKATELEPYYALPYAILGMVQERLQDGPGALASYEAYLARASLRDPQRPAVARRHAEVKEILSVSRQP